MPRSSGAIIARVLRNREADILTPLIDEYLLVRDRAEHRLMNHTIDMRPRLRPGGRFSPSSLEGCEREAVFKFLGVKKVTDIDPELELLFEDGNWRHHKWQALFLDMELVLGSDRFHVVSYESEAQIRDIYVAGSLDVHIIINDSQHIIVDIKGINERGFKRICIDENKPMDKHVGQISAYMKARKVKKGILLYDSKDTNQLRCYSVDYNPRVWGEVKEWVQGPIEHLNNRTLPKKDPECRRGQFQYNRCPHAWLCYGKKSEDEIRDYAYRRFRSIERSWKRGLRALEQDRADRAV